MYLDMTYILMILPAMIFSVILLFIALLCTLSVRNIVVKKEEE